MEQYCFPLLNTNVSRIGLGTWSIGGWMWGGSDEDEAIETILKALSLGINFIDTAPVYGFGRSEEIVGKALKKYKKRDRVFLATKVGLGWHEGKIFRDSRKEDIEKEVEDSLKRLQVDYIDLYQVHWPDAKTPFAETAEALKKLLDQGKIRSVGVSNFSMEQMDTFSQFLPIQSLQSPFNLFETGIEKSERLYCMMKNMAIIGYGSLCRGLLTGKMQANMTFKGDDLRNVDPKFQEPRFSQYLRCISHLKDWAQLKYQKSLLALAFRWVLDKQISVALWGARKPEQLRGIENIEGWSLTEQDFQEIDRIIQQTVPDPIGPEFMAPPERDS